MQVIRPALLHAGFELVQRDNLEVTDDVSIIEALGEPVKVTSGSYSNIKVTEVCWPACRLPAVPVYVRSLLPWL